MSTICLRPPQRTTARQARLRQSILRNHFLEIDLKNKLNEPDT